MEKASVLVTGGSGFVGRRLVDRLVNRAGSLKSTLSVVVAGRKAPTAAGPVAHEMLDLNDRASIDRALASSKPDVIVHLAAQSSVGVAIGAGALTWSANLGGSLNLAQSIAEHLPEATLLYASSAEVYGRAFNDGVATEGTVPDPQSAYSRSKFAAEQMFSDVLPDTAKLIVVRPSNHSGRGQDARFVLPSFASQILAGQSEIHVGNLAAQRDFLHVDDVIDAYIALITGADKLAARSVYNIASGQVVTIGSLLDRLIALSGAKASVVVDPARLRPVEIPVTQLDASLLRRAVGWAPTRSIDTMLQEILDSTPPERG